MPPPSFALEFAKHKQGDFDLGNGFNASPKTLKLHRRRQRKSLRQETKYTTEFGSVHRTFSGVCIYEYTAYFIAVYSSRIKVRLTAPPFGRLPTADIARQRRARTICTPLRTVLRKIVEKYEIPLVSVPYLMRGRKSKICISKWATVAVFPWLTTAPISHLF